jgi:hypothetical protein
VHSIWDQIKARFPLEGNESQLVVGAAKLLLTALSVSAGCRIYNAVDTIYYKTAVKLESFLDQYLNTHVLYE